jgi:NAD-dependent deacetylase
LLHHIIIQNVDNLHQDAGSKAVIEFHGNSSTLSCPTCGETYLNKDKSNENPPRCSCGQILRPDVVFFGEAIPTEALHKSFQLAARAQAVIIAGTSAEVSPANTIPSVAKQNNARIIEMNLEETHLTHTITDVFLKGDVGTKMTQLVEAVKEKIPDE